MVLFIVLKIMAISGIINDSKTFISKKKNLVKVSYINKKLQSY